MTARNHPWLVSLAAHSVLVLAAAVLLRVPETPAALRMHLSPAGSTSPMRTAMTVPTGPASKPSAPGLPAWNDHAATASEQRAPVPVSLDDILGAQAEPAETRTSGWISDGYVPPPLPPPGLAPPQGARWTLVVLVPAGGGPGAAEGLDSGHPELDHWLETYLRSVSFPAGLDGEPYQLHWNLALVSDRPR